MVTSNNRMPNGFGASAEREGDHFLVLAPRVEHTEDTPRYLVTLDRGIGDAVAVGLSVVDQIISNDPDSYGAIDVLCNPRQSEIFQYDPRVNRIIQTPLAFFPSLQVSSWVKLIKPEAQAKGLVRFLQGRPYEALFPGIIAPALFYRVHAPIMYPNIIKLINDLFIVGGRVDKPVRKIVRGMVNRYFGKNIPEAALADDVILYLSTQQIQKATMIVKTLKEQSITVQKPARLLVIAPDSASTVTRPPTALLSAALTDVLKQCSSVVVSILPSYTETLASLRLKQALTPAFGSRVFTIPAKPGLTLLETAALIDQANVFVSGDTGVMHLAVATKKLKPGDGHAASPEKRVKIITLFGGTNPGFYGYPQRTVILGRGRKEQRSFRPGFSKEAYDPKGRHFFDHIAPQELSAAIMSQL